MASGMWPPIAGLAVALLVDCPAPRRPTLSGWGLLLDTIPYIALTALASAAAAAAFAKHSKDRDQIVMRVAACALWCAPLIVLIRDGSAWAIVPLVALVASAAPLFPFGKPVAESPPAADVFQIPDIRLLRQLPSSLAAAVCLQAAAVAGLMEHPLIAGPVLAAGTAVLSRKSGPGTRPSRAGISVACAVLFTLFGMVPYLATGGGSALAGSGGGNGNGSNPRTGDAAAHLEAGESFRGIILWPPVQKHVTIVAPLPAMPSNPFAASQNPLSIPFFGAYWFFRTPNTRPPEGSAEMHGNPTDLTFRSLSARPLLMEARQNLGKLIALNCCQRIEVAILNRDRYSGIVSIELILIDTTVPEKPSLSLGVSPVTSHPGFTVSRDTVPAPEILRFPIPQARLIQRFDELVVRFERAPMRAQRSANIAIDRFVLIPAGR
jgi:hypothetical protein